MNLKAKGKVQIQRLMLPINSFRMVQHQVPIHQLSSVHEYDQLWKMSQERHELLYSYGIFLNFKRKA